MSDRVKRERETQSREARLREENVVRSAEDIPEFETEAEEAEFWATHSMGGQLLESGPQAIAEAEAELPPPCEYSGKVNLRMPKSLHRDLAHSARQEGVSLNQVIVTALARFVGTER